MTDWEPYAAAGEDRHGDGHRSAGVGFVVVWLAIAAIGVGMVLLTLTIGRILGLP